MERSLQAITARDGGDPPSLFLRLPAVMRLTGLGRSTIYRMVADNRFPCPVASHRPRSLERIASDRHALSITASFNA
jgi:Prophage CP4-57 regulatory protein (AlpA)